jgi:radical SAM protein with 4Fe4S-binding SPASM domain
MDPNVVYKIIDECVALGVKEMGFFVLGEPLLVDELHQYIKYAKDKGIEYTFITTNCEYLIPSRFIPIVEAGLDSIKFSITAGSRDLYRKMHNIDNFDLVIAHIKGFCEYLKSNNLTKPITSVGTIYWPGKEEDIKQLEDLVAPYVDDIYALPLYNQGGLLPNERCIVGNPGRCKTEMDPVIPCWTLFNMAIIRWDGTLEMCCFGHDDKFLVENVKDVSLSEAWNNYKFVALRREHLEGDIKHPSCRKCLGMS